MVKKDNYKHLAHFVYEAGTLRKTARAHRQTLLTDDLSDNIASHSFRVSLIGYLLAEQEKADALKVMAMCLTHDLGEARSGDQNWVHKKYVKVFEDEITNDQLTNVSKNLLNLSKEYQERESKEAIIAKDADLIDQILLLKEYEWRGNKEATRWLGGKNRDNRNNKHIKMLKTASAKKLALEILKQQPGEWWENIWTDKRR